MTVSCLVQTCDVCDDNVLYIFDLACNPIDNFAILSVVKDETAIDGEVIEVGDGINERWPITRRGIAKRAIRKHEIVLPALKGRTL